MEGVSLYVAGTTSDNDLRGYSSISGPTPLIARYAFSGSAFTYLWGRTVVTDGDYTVNGIAIP